MKKCFWILPFLLFPLSASAAPSKAVFTSVRGTVLVEPAQGEPFRAKTGASVIEGDRVSTGSRSRAELRTLDGSKVRVGPDSSVVLGSHRKKGEDWIVRFELKVGTLLAMVKKLATQSSTFEVDAGGVVCGVRGTEFKVEFDPAKDRVLLDVLKGDVFAKTGGKVRDFGEGSGAEFLKGALKDLRGKKPRHPADGRKPRKERDGKQSKPPVRPSVKPVIPVKPAVLVKPPVLVDLQKDFTGSLIVVGDVVRTDPSVGGVKPVSVRAVVPAVEKQP